MSLTMVGCSSCSHCLIRRRSTLPMMPFSLGRGLGRLSSACPLRAARLIREVSWKKRERADLACEEVASFLETEKMQRLVQEKLETLGDFVKMPKAQTKFTGNTR
jgi:hypothetical protein